MASDLRGLEGPGKEHQNPTRRHLRRSGWALGWVKAVIQSSWKEQNQHVVSLLVWRPWRDGGFSFHPDQFECGTRRQTQPKMLSLGIQPDATYRQRKHMHPRLFWLLQKLNKSQRPRWSICSRRSWTVQVYLRLQTRFPDAYWLQAFALCLSRVQETTEGVWLCKRLWSPWIAQTPSENVHDR